MADPGRRVRLGSALFNADHTHLAAELHAVEQAGIDFFHLDVFDGYAVPDQGFPARTIAALRPLTKLPFEVHLTATDPLRFVPHLADAGVNLIFLPAETTRYLYEATYELRQRNVTPGICLALGTPLTILEPILPMVESVLLLGRVTGEGPRGRAFNDLVLQRVQRVRQMIDSQSLGTPTDLQAAGGLELESSLQVCRLGATSRPLGGALHRQKTPDGRGGAPSYTAYLQKLRSLVRHTETA